MKSTPTKSRISSHCVIARGHENDRSIHRGDTMKKISKWVTGVTITALLAGLSVPAFASENGNVQAYDESGVTILLQFKDLKNAEWALRYIASMEAEGVFRGYEDGTFRPSEAISRVQAVVTAVRLMGLEDEASAKANTQLNFKDADKISHDYGWATGYIAVALEKGLFDAGETELHPGQPASRLWVASLLVRAMGLENEALQKMNTKLPFADADRIPATSVGYVAVAVEKGILKGYPDNTFQPKNPVTRAEMSALLDRTNVQLPTDMKLKKKRNKIEMEGRITAISGNSLTIRDEDGKENTFDLSDKILVFHSDGRGSMASLSVGDKIEIKFKHGRAVLIEVEKKAQKIEGTVASIMETTVQPTTNGSEEQQTVAGSVYGGKTYELVIKTEDGEKTVYVTSDTQISAEGVTNPTISDVKVGDRVEVKTNGNLALFLKVEQEENDGEKFETEGTFVKMDGSTITIKDESGQETTYTLATDLKIKYEGHADAKLADLHDGLKVSLKGENKLVHEIEIED